MVSTIISELTSTAATSDLEVPSDIAKTNDFRSLQNHAAVDALLRNESLYKDIKWNTLKGYSIPFDDANITSGIWIQGYRLFYARTGRYWWLCRRCHYHGRMRKGTTQQMLYVVDRTTSGPIQHLKEAHKVDSNGETVINKRKSPLDSYHRQGGDDEAQAAENTLGGAFDQHHFKALLYDWLISNNIAFEQLDSPSFRRLLTYATPRAAGCIPSAVTTSRTVGALYDKALGAVTESLRSAQSKINFSFDLWTSKNKLALLGLCAHYIDDKGSPITTLLALPRQKGRHNGFNIAETVSAIIAEYSLQDKIGYFTTDNAFANATCLDYLANEYRFKRDKRWVRCSGHIFNLVGQAALFGKDSKAFFDALEITTVEDLELAIWRRKGPTGKLHNIVYWINKSPQRVERFEALQRELIAPVRPDGKKATYELIKDVETR